MAVNIYPFAAFRPKPVYAKDVASPPNDVLTTEEARTLADGNPLSYLHVAKSEIDLPASIPPYDSAVYKKAKENLDGMINSDIMIHDEKPCLYIYRLSLNGRTQTGLACCVSVHDYEQELIKKHELTRLDKERDRVEHITACGAHTEPIFLAYRAEQNNASGNRQRNLMRNWTDSHEAVYDFITDDNVNHKLWVVDDSTAVQEIASTFGELPCLYIADGHHRSAAAVKTAENIRSGKIDASVNATDARAEYDCYLSVVFPHDELAILDYNRVVKDLNGLTVDGFLAALSEAFTAEICGEAYRPAKPDEYGLYMQGTWRKLVLKTPAPKDTVDGLAVSVLQQRLFAPILGITDPQTNKRIDFIGGATGLKKLTRLVDNGEMAAGFTVCPTTLQELFAVSDEGRIMPPKSTWFEPKLLSGLLIHKFSI